MAFYITHNISCIKYLRFFYRAFHFPRRIYNLYTRKVEIEAFFRNIYFPPDLSARLKQRVLVSGGV